MTMDMIKRFDEMTEEEIVGDAMRAVPDYLATIRDTGDFRLERCVGFELGRIRKLFRESRARALPPSPAKVNLNELDIVLAYFEPLLRERTLPVMQHYLKGRRVSEINAAAARAILSGAFGGAGLDAEVTGQRYRARVDVKIRPGTVLRLYVRYRDLAKEGIVGDTLKAVLDLKDALTRLGPGASVGRK